MLLETLVVTKKGEGVKFCWRRDVWVLERLSKEGKERGWGLSWEYDLKEGGRGYAEVEERKRKTKKMILEGKRYLDIGKMKKRINF